MSLQGARPSQEQKCLTVGKRDMSVPISERMVLGQGGADAVHGYQVHADLVERWRAFLNRL